MSIFGKKVVLTEEEEQIHSTIEKMVGNSKCLIDINPESMSYLLEIESLQYYAHIDGNGVEISNHTFFISRRLGADVLDKIKKVISEESARRWTLKKGNIFKNQTELIERIKTNIGDGNSK